MTYIEQRDDHDDKVDQDDHDHQDTTRTPPGDYQKTTPAVLWQPGPQLKHSQKPVIRLLGPEASPALDTFCCGSLFLQGRGNPRVMKTLFHPMQDGQSFV